MSDNQETLIDRAVAWCRASERSDAEYLDREFAYTLVRNPLLFVAFRAGQHDRQAEIERLREVAEASRVVYEARYHGVSGAKRSAQWARLRAALDALSANDRDEEGA